MGSTTRISLSMSPRKHMMSDAPSEAIQIAEDYYNSADADHFYQTVWGGEDIHIGLYEPEDSIAAASRRTVRFMADQLATLTAGARVLDLGSGYGGAARALAADHGAHVTCLNLSAVENARNRAMTREAGLSASITVLDGAFENAPLDDGSIDIAWSQDALLHSGDRRQVLREVWRVLRPGGEVIFTEPMQADELDDPSALQPIYDRLHLTDLGSIAFYRSALREIGFEEVAVRQLTDQLEIHYSRVASELTDKRESLEGKISTEYIDRMLVGLNHWVRGAIEQRLTWGVLHFKKPSPTERGDRLES